MITVINRILLLGLLLLLACESKPTEVLQSGPWRAVLSLNDSTELPFQFELNASLDQLSIINGDERIQVDEVEVRGDSLWWRMPIFDSEFHLAIRNNVELVGEWWNYSRGTDYRIPVRAAQGTMARFSLNSENPVPDLAPTWAVTFGSEGEESYPAIGEFRQSGKQVQGTFLTETGDYRYLAGGLKDSSLMLSCFDGAHAFLFTARMQVDGRLKGHFYSGNHYLTQWTAIADAQAVLRDPDSLTYLQEGYEQLAFTFPNLAGQPVSLEDGRYKGKVVIVQIMGSWCPNCMDESRLYSQWYDRYRQQGLEIIGLAYERTRGDTTRAFRNLRRLKERFGIGYELLLASTSNSKAAAGESLPMLNHVLSYPTSIFIDRKGRVRRIHTGFNGPGTGAPYQRFLEEYEAFLEKLLGELDPESVARI